MVLGPIVQPTTTFGVERHVGGRGRYKKGLRLNVSTLVDGSIAHIFSLSVPLDLRVFLEAGPGSKLVMR